MHTIWFDLTNTPHNIFFKPIYNHLKNKYNIIFSMREFAETENLFKKLYNVPYKVIGNHKGANKILKIVGVIERTFLLNLKIPKFDIKISVGGDASNYIAKMREKNSITFDDNETAPNWRYSRFSDFSFWPNVIDKNILIKQNFNSSKLYQYNGYKEDIYIADYIPDNSFLSYLPFDNYVLVRPENVQANYIQNGKVESIVPDLLNQLNKKGHNVIYLPRYESDRKYAKGISNIFIPEKPLNGLDACYFADAVLTGAGTLAREAACLGVPAVSFYAGKNLLAVDKSMIQKGWTFFSRNSIDIINYLTVAKRRETSFNRSKTVKNEVIDKLDEVIDRLC